MAFAYGSIDDFGTGLFRKVRQELGVTAFGVNAMVLPPQRFELGPGGVCHVESTSPRRVWNAGDEALVLLVVGGKGGYIGRDGHMVDPADEERRRAFSSGEEAVIRRLPE